MFQLIIASALALFTTTTTTTETCEPTDLLAENEEPVAELVCGAPMCVYTDPTGSITTKRCDTSCVWEAGIAEVCGGWTCTSLTPASACRWHCQ